jgi:hypothetical protein
MSYGLENIDFRSITYLQQFSEKHRKHGDFLTEKGREPVRLTGRARETNWGWMLILVSPEGN